MATGRGAAAQGFLDLENLVGPWAGEHGADAVARFVVTVRAVRRLVPGIALVGVGDRRLVALLARWVPTLEGVRLFGGDEGPDRADGELLERLASNVWARTGTVVIGSGDHVFAEAGRRLRESGRRVIVVGRRGTVSHHLYPASHRVVTLEDLWAGYAHEVAA